MGTITCFALCKVSEIMGTITCLTKPHFPISQRALWCDRTAISEIRTKQQSFTYLSLVKSQISWTILGGRSIYVKGGEKTKRVEVILGTSCNIVDLEDYGCPSLQVLKREEIKLVSLSHSGIYRFEWAERSLRNG
ncbi:hypothetical protein PR048_018934 [Dryococelus australis]|uniref:Uncharacterized protein n=1 Tax=Dryococelus australis TaxID=614101 RepID=A0ABQ9H226_9NEOP|nr:hypothetical protein PR048_018934 [Dryococelus australis]